MLKRGGTRLSVIPKHTLWLECACGHNGPVQVADVIAKWGHEISVGDVVDRVRCSACRTKRIKEYRIIYAGGSAVAMRGAEQGPQR